MAASDNLGLKKVSIGFSGGVVGVLDTTFTSAVTEVTLGVDLQFPEDTPVGGRVLITATATDGNDNSESAVDSVFLFNEDALIVELLIPPDSAVTSQGKQLLVEVRAAQQDGVRRLGYLVTGVVTGGDSTSQLSPMPLDTTFTDTLDVPAGAAEGAFTITGFAVDSADRRVEAPPVTVFVQSVTNDTEPPVVSFTVAARVEVDDSITVTASDPSGITEIGWEARDTAGTVVGGASTTLAGNLSPVTETWSLEDFKGLELPHLVIIRAFATDGAGNADTTGVPAGAPPAGPLGSAAAAQQQDTVTVVHGITVPLPPGSRINDAIYNRNRNEIYLTNTEFDRLEVFRVTDSTLNPEDRQPIFVGSRPWGIALWPSDTLGNNADTVVVANSGGTNFSIVDVAERREKRRHHLPLFRVQTVQTKIDEATGLIKLDIVEYHLSDRPQYLGTFCRTGGGTACQPDSVYAVYSTTPTAGQSGVLRNRSTVRWENISSNSANESHFFWEHASATITDANDTLQIFVPRGPGAQDTLLSSICGEIVSVVQLGFVDTTFVRNSGNFTHMLVGEGGSIVEPPMEFARAMGHSMLPGVTEYTCSFFNPLDSTTISGPEIIDFGISPSIRLRDFIANTATRVKSIAINFNGLTNLIRADSIYVLDEKLRLQGLVAVGGENAGMDLNFDHAFDAGNAGTPTFGGTLDPNDRFVFAASEDPVIDVFDTFFYEPVRSIAIRDPVIGPLRVARSVTGDQILIGVTGAGVVVVQLPAVTNIFPTPVVGSPRR